jgi:hypothetical protein
MSGDEAVKRSQIVQARSALPPTLPRATHALQVAVRPGCNLQGMAWKLYFVAIQAAISSALADPGVVPD